MLPADTPAALLPNVYLNPSSDSWFCHVRQERGCPPTFIARMKIVASVVSTSLRSHILGRTEQLQGGGTNYDDFLL